MTGCLTRYVLAGLLALTLTGCASASYLVPKGGTSSARGFQQAAEQRWQSVQFNLDRMAYDDEQAILKDPSWPVPYAQLSQVFWALGQPQAALSEAKAALRLDPKNATYADNLGQLALHQRNWAQAAKAFQTARVLKPLDWVAATGQALIAMHNNKWSTAAALLHHALLWGGPQGPIYDAWGRFYLMTHQDSVAIAYFSDAASVNPSWWRPYYDWARAEIQLGQRSKAEANLQKALTDAPGKAQAWTLYQSLVKTRPPSRTWTP